VEMPVREADCGSEGRDLQRRGEVTPVLDVPSACRLAVIPPAGAVPTFASKRLISDSLGLGSAIGVGIGSVRSFVSLRICLTSLTSGLDVLFRFAGAALFAALFILPALHKCVKRDPCNGKRDLLQTAPELLVG
jgi:hypothetical protein